MKRLFTNGLLLVMLLSVLCSFEVDRRGIFLIDDTPVPYDTLYEAGSSGRLEITIWSENQRDAIMRFGERYRYGIMGFESVNNE